MEMDKKKNIKDLLNDPSFSNWAQKTNDEDVAKWDKWIADHPDQEELVDEAKWMLKGIPFKKKTKSAKEANASWDSFSQKLKTESTPPIPIKRATYPWLKIAAAVLFLVASILVIQRYTGEDELVFHTTEFGETKEILLPDGSKLNLNANSSVTFYDNWKRQKTHQIRLEGEAFFTIRPQATGHTVKVNTKDLSVQVIGTSFNLNSKRKNSIVSLIEGKVNLEQEVGVEHLLQAGQTAVFDEDQKRFIIQDDQTAYWQAWTMKKWALGKATPLSEVLQRIEETFGLKPEVMEKGILSMQASGDVSIESQAVLLEALSVLFGLDIQVQGDKVLIAKEKEE